MWCVRVIVILFSFLTPDRSQCRKIDDFENLVMQMNIKSERIDTRKSNVYINQSAYEIFFYDTAITSEIKYHDNTSVKFYTCVNCEFAALIRDELFRVVEMLPVVYDKTIANNVFQHRFSTISHRLDGIGNKTDRFTDILSNVAQSIDSATIDKSLLIALLSLRLKIDYIKTLHKRGGLEVDDTMSEDGLDPKVVRLLLKSLTEIEIFSSLNCGVKTFHDQKLFERRLLEDYDERENPEFLQYVDPSKLESTSKNRCSLFRMLLGNVLNGENTLSREMMNVEISVGCSGVVLLKDAFAVVQTARDLEVIYWYQKFVLRIIMKLLCENIRLFLGSYDADQVIPSTVGKPFRRISAQFFSEPIGTPAGIIDCFELFASKTKLSSHEVHFVNEQISLYLNDLKGSVNSNQGQNRKKSTHEATKKVSNDPDLSPLEKYLADIETNIDEYECFMQLYKLLNKEFDSYYAPFVMNYEKITDFVVGSELCDWTTDEEFTSDWARRSQVIKHLNNVFSFTDVITVFYKYELNGKEIVETDITKNPTKSLLINKGCEYTMSLISFCFYIIKNFDTRTMTTVSDSSIFSSAFGKLDEIRKALLAVVKIYPNHYFQKIAYQLLPYIDVLGEKCINNSTIVSDSLIRIVSLFVNVLNYYSLEYCYPPQFDFIMFNEFYVSLLSGEDQFNTIKVNSFSSIVNNTKRLESGNKIGIFVGIANLFQMYEMSSKKHKWYQDSISFEWNGKHISIEEIYVHITSILVRPIYVYTFFDVFLKFHLAIIYYEIRVFYRLCKNLETIDADCQSFKNVAENILKNTKFPNQFLGVLGRLNEYLILMYEGICEKNNRDFDANDLEEEISIHFKRIDVLIKTTQKHENENAPETDIFYSSITRPGHCTEFHKYENNSFYTELEKMINEVLESVTLINTNMLNNIAVYTN